MKNWFIIVTVLFVLLIGAMVIGADTGHLPRLIDNFYHFPGGDKVGHFILFGILSFLLNRSALALFPDKNPVRLILIVSLILAIMIALEEWSQVLFPLRTASFIDLAAGYLGVCIFAILAYRTGH